jgi:hypothetical protein
METTRLVAYLAALDRIAAANREPTPQKAGCLFSALGAMASDDERAAEQWIARCQHADSQSTMKCSCIPSPRPRGPKIAHLLTYPW